MTLAIAFPMRRNSPVLNGLTKLKDMVFALAEASALGNRMYLPDRLHLQKTVVLS